MGGATAAPFASFTADSAVQTSEKTATDKPAGDRGAARAPTAFPPIAPAPHEEIGGRPATQSAPQSAPQKDAPAKTASPAAFPESVVRASSAALETARTKTAAVVDTLTSGLAGKSGQDDNASDDRLQTATISDEQVSLVSWLTESFEAGAQDVRPICLTDTCCPTVVFIADSLFLWQGNIPSRPLFLDTATGATALDLNQLQNSVAVAPRYSLIYNRDDCRALELNYFQVWGFDAQRQIGPTFDPAGDGAYTINNVITAGSLPGTAQATVTSSAHIQSAEFNLRYRDGGSAKSPVTWITGFRWLEWGQQLSIEEGIGSGGAVVASDLPTVQTLNSLYGWQWGGDLMIWNAGRWLRINGVGKAGVYYNHQALQNTTYNDFTNPPLSVSAARDTVSFMGETGINASLSITERISLRAGYTFFWLGGLATPSRQLGLTDAVARSTSVNVHDSVLLHGATAGFDIRW